MHIFKELPIELRTGPMKEISEQIARNLITLRGELGESIKNLNKDIEEAAKEFRVAAAHGDISENVAYTDAMDKLAMLSKQKLILIERLSDINDIKDDLNYVPKGYIGIYSTIRLYHQSYDHISLWKIYPGEIHDTKKHIMSCNAPIYKLLKDKVKGDVIEFPHKISGELLKTTILDVY